MKPVTNVDFLQILFGEVFEVSFGEWCISLDNYFVVITRVGDNGNILGSQVGNFLVDLDVALEKFAVLVYVEKFVRSWGGAVDDELFCFLFFDLSVYYK